ncbi:serine protease Do [Dysgonomonas sp. PFB1-18]|uniref:Do family serine endopeptidase n=1 Tax=unclassified Dysgonomonas TaxID=2630389 RepID=UPI0024749300|nr:MULTISPECIES: Do family serine endopeptidase [unclassified Dysgonomonas]MDL2303623.1 Do family serine endopeptidase [Dysgonomonas sp. OttesenSCG-928-D17]MDH6309734.1 serine protease Do [Dysgonomonas sp. PF1-14]MDH6339258.1 serine protease Do [Dysgonomonas sp. PF1-16]MDH6380757.1 serine protease Do [Dysgonomonas sp. PFB1-18]MDH6398253.1 serine protease Do [Dysgonomonas sp. PF1-23]
MKNFWKNVSTYVVVALVSIGATYGMYSYMDYRKGYSSSDTYNYGHEFDQSGVHLASLTADGYPDFTKAAENSIHAVVHIKSTVKAQSSSSPQRQGRQRMIDPFEFFFGNPGGGGDNYQYGSPQPSVGFGSGVIISKDGYIVTNNHVIEKADEIEVTLNDNSKYTAKLIGTDPQTDIALLKVEGKDLPYIPFGNSDNLKVGEWVLAVGNPFNLTSTVTAGIVSAKGRGGIGSFNQGNIQSFIQTDAAINRGNSGGALVNTNGELIGINTAIYSQTGDFAGYGFAVPISIAGKVVADIKEFGTVQRAVLGVMIQDISTAKEADPEKTKNIKVNEGIHVSGFAEMSPAKQAGVEEGDVITAVNGVKVKNVSELQDQINRFRPGDKVKLDIVRGAANKNIDVTLKTSTGSTSVVKKEDAVGSAGAAFKELTTEKKKQLGISYGVEVAGVDNAGKFHKEGIAKGFVILKINNQTVSSPVEVERIIQATSNSQDKVLFISGITSNGERKYYAVDLSE